MNVTNSIVDFFQGNPFNNPVGSYIEKATDSKNEVENWTLFMEICDTINAMEDGPRMAIRAIKRILNSEISNNTTTVLYTLVLLETCVKNCGYRFHLVVCTRDFLQDLEKIVTGISQSKLGRNEVPIVVRDKVLSLIQSWYNSFKRQPDLKEIESTFMYLLECGVKFPKEDSAMTSPTKTPKNINLSSQSSVEEVSKSVSPHTSITVAEPRPTAIPAGVVDKLSKNLVVVQSNIDVLSGLMNEHPPSDSVPDDVICLMKNLESVCQQMQLRLVELINSWDETDQKDASILFDLLRVNDEMNTVLIQYERYERARTNQVNKNLPEGELLSQMGAADDKLHPQMTQFSDDSNTSKSKDNKVAPGLAAPSADEVQPLLAMDNNNCSGTASSANALSSQEFDQFLNEHTHNSFTINGDHPPEVSVAGRTKPFAPKGRTTDKASFDL